MSQESLDRLLIGVLGTCVLCQKTTSPTSTESDVSLKMLMRCLNINVLKLFNIRETDSSESDEYMDRVSLNICVECNVHASQFFRAFEKLKDAYQSIDNVALALREKIVAGERIREQDIFSLSSPRMYSLISANSGLHLRKELIPKLYQLRFLAASGPLTTGLFSLFTLRVPLPFSNSFNNGPSSSHVREDSNVSSHGPSISEFLTNGRTMEEYRDVPNDQRTTLTSEITVENPSFILKTEPADPIIVSIEGANDQSENNSPDADAAATKSPAYEYNYMRASSTSTNDTVTVPVRRAAKRLTAKNSNGHYECGICDKTCSTYAGIYMHRKSKHPNDPNVSQKTRLRATAASRTSTGPGPRGPALNTRNFQSAGYECHFCKRGFKNPSDRENHEVTIHAFDKLAGKLPQTATEEKLKSVVKTFVQASQTEGRKRNVAAVCIGCGHEFKRGGKIKIHILKQHVNMLSSSIEKETREGVV